MSFLGTNDSSLTIAQGATGNCDGRRNTAGTSAAGDTLVNVEGIIGGICADTLTGNAGDNPSVVTAATT